MTNIEGILGTSFDDRIDGNGAGIQHLTTGYRFYGNDGNDILRSDAGDDVLDGGAGNDALKFGGGRDIVYGGSGEDDIYSFDGLSDTIGDILDGGSGDDRIWANDGHSSDIVSGGDGNDLIQFSDGDWVSGGNGSDTFVLSGFGSSTPYRATIADLGPGEIIKWTFVTPVVIDFTAVWFIGPIAYGSGVNTDLDHIELSNADGQTKLYFGYDTNPGADFILTLAGTFTPDQFQVDQSQGYQLSLHVLAEGPTVRIVSTNVQSGDGVSLSWPNLYDQWANSSVQAVGTANAFTLVSTGGFNGNVSSVKFVLSGTNFTFGTDSDGNIIPTGGNIYGVALLDSSDNPLATFDGFDISAAAFSDALRTYADGHGPGGDNSPDPTALDALFASYRYDAFGNAGSDILQGSDLGDTLRGGGGNDIFESSPGVDMLIGGSGFDLADYTDASAGLTVDLSDPSNNTGDALADSYLSIENVRGSIFDDILIGDADNNTLEGIAGNDWLDGGVGADTMAGGAGFDTIHGGSENDQIGGGDQGDLVFGEDGNDLINGGMGLDTIDGGADNDTINGGIGNDNIFGNVGFDDIHGNDGNDTVNGGDQGDIITGDAGDDVIGGGMGLDSIDGGVGDDTITGGMGNDLLTGGTDADTFAFGSPGAANDGLDSISDFVSGTDTIQVSAAGYGGGLIINAPVTLVVAASAAAANSVAGGYFIFDNSGADSGTVYWDVSGGSGADAVAIAVVTGVASLQASDFHVV